MRAYQLVPHFQLLFFYAVAQAGFDFVGVAVQEDGQADNEGFGDFEIAGFGAAFDVFVVVELVAAVAQADGA